MASRRLAVSDSAEMTALRPCWFRSLPHERGNTVDVFFEDDSPLQREWVESGRVDDLSAIIREMQAEVTERD
jgi:hypothetical protein